MRDVRIAPAASTSLLKAWLVLSRPVCGDLSNDTGQNGRRMAWSNETVDSARRYRKNRFNATLGMLKKAASGVLAFLPCSRTESTLRASKRLRPCWTDPSERLRACFFEHSQISKYLDCPHLLIFMFNLKPLPCWWIYPKSLLIHQGDLPFLPIRYRHR